MDEFSIATKKGIKQSKDSFSNKTKLKIIKPPFGYFGSKAKIARHILEKLPPHNCWVEAFCGSAALTCAKQIIAPIEVINDIDNKIVNLFTQLRNNHKELIRVIESTPYARKELEEARLINESDSDLEKARKFFIESMFAMNSVFGKSPGGFSYSQSYSRNGKDARVNRWNNLPDRLKILCERFKNVRIENMDGIKILKMFTNRPATLIYLDPPYLGNRTSGYNHDTNDEKYHEELLKTANEANCMIFISGYQSDLYDDLLSSNNGWTKKSIDTFTKVDDGQIHHKRTELLWMNRQFQEAIGLDEAPIVLSEKERKENKLNPMRRF